MINILFFVVCLVTCRSNHKVGGSQNIPNNLPIKTIHTKYGDIVDCFDINNQPAFQNPLLKNHKLQRKPNFQNSIRRTGAKRLSTRSIFGLEKNQCPRGTVPIRRTTKADPIQTKLLSNYHTMSPGNPGVHVAELSQSPEFGPYYGVEGIVSIYNPHVYKNDQFSSAHLWVENGPADSKSTILAGWHVAPILYDGHNYTTMFTLWTSDSLRQTGCFNYHCSGFVQLSRQIYLGLPVRTVSTDTRNVDIGLSIKQDPVSKNWWLSSYSENIGYFPAALFSDLNSAYGVGWGGRTTTTQGTPSPPMGSGRFPKDITVSTCYFGQISFQNASRQDNGPQADQTFSFNDKPDCYRVKYYGNLGPLGHFLQFGGPGGNNCGY